MKYDLEFLEEALDDLQESFIWYESKKIGLGQEFYNSVKNAFIELQEFPKRSQKILTNVLRFVLKNFPFNIFFVIDEEVNKIKILAIYHGSRNPYIWQNRISGST
jgi:plasmid stabilization system protein ParE